MAATRKKKERTLSYNSAVGALHVRQGGKEKGYLIDQLPHDFGPAVRCFRLSKIVPPTDGSPEHYDVVLSAGGDSCECIGHLRHGHNAPCRHVAALRRLVEMGLI